MIQYSYPYCLTTLARSLRLPLRFLFQGLGSYLMEPHHKEATSKSYERATLRIPVATPREADVRALCDISRSSKSQAGLPCQDVKPPKSGHIAE